MKLLLIIIFLIPFFFLAPKEALAQNDGLSADPIYFWGGTNVSTGQSYPRGWYVTIRNDGSVYQGEEVVSLHFGYAWCNLTSGNSCDSNHLDYRGLTGASDFNISVPAPGETLFQQFSIGRDVICGRVQGDIFYNDEILGGNISPFASDCAMSASLFQVNPTITSCTLSASWDVGLNDDPNCQIKVEAGGTLYKLSN